MRILISSLLFYIFIQFTTANNYYCWTGSPTSYCSDPYPICCNPLPISGSGGLCCNSGTTCCGNAYGVGKCCSSGYYCSSDYTCVAEDNTTSSSFPIWAIPVIVVGFIFFICLIIIVSRARSRVIQGVPLPPPQVQIQMQQKQAIDQAAYNRAMYEQQQRAMYEQQQYQRAMNSPPPSYNPVMAPVPPANTQDAIIQNKINELNVLVAQRNSQIVYPPNAIPPRQIINTYPQNAPNVRHSFTPGPVIFQDNVSIDQTQYNNNYVQQDNTYVVQQDNNYLQQNNFIQPDNNFIQQNNFVQPDNNYVQQNNFVQPDNNYVQPDNSYVQQDNTSYDNSSYM